MEEEVQETGETGSSEAAQSANNLNKACEPCRSSKLRCIIDDNTPDGSCKRCVATGRTCIFKAPRLRQRRKLHVDARVAELERQLRALRIQLNEAQRPQGPDGRFPPSASTTLKFEPPVTPASWPRKSDASGFDLVPYDTGQPTPPKTSTGTDIAAKEQAPRDDVITRNVLSLQEAKRLVQVYFALFAANYPFVPLPTFTTTEVLRETRPATFLAVLAAASVTMSPEMNATLNHELLTLVARRLMLEGEHSLDLVQAIIIMTIWYAPLDRFESLRHYQFAHLAATVAYDIGLGDEPEKDLNRDAVSSEDLDGRRTMLGIYLLCTGLAITTGRPNMLRFTPYKQNTFMRLRAQPNMSKTDRWFLAWVDLQRITENAAHVFFSGQASLDISHPDTQNLIVKICQRLDDWRSGLGFELGGALEIHYHYVRSIVLCVCLYVNHDLDDFRPPFRVRPLDAAMPPSPALTPFFARTVLSLVETVHAALNAFLSFDKDGLLAVPMVYYVRTCHPLSILLMLDMSCRRSGNELSKILDQDTLMVEHYFRAFERMLSTMADTDTRKAPSKFLDTILRMKTWWRSQCKGLTTEMQDLRPFSRQEEDAAESTNASLSSSHTTSRAAATPVPAYGQNTPTVADNAYTGVTLNQDELLLDNWVFDLEQDPASLLMPEIDWSLFDNQAASIGTDSRTDYTQIPPG